MKEALLKARSEIFPCIPPAWAATGHLQTIIGHLLPSLKMSETGEKILISKEDGPDQIHSTYYAGTKPVVVYLFHGLGGSAESSYMQRTAMIARNLGFHVFMNNHRGCGEGVGLASEPYHSGRAEDLSTVIAFGRNKIPQAKHIAIGFSLSANALLLLAAGVRADVLPDAAIAVNAPINLELASQKLCEGLSWIYNYRFVLDLKNYVKQNRKKDYSLIKGIHSIRTIDESFTAPIGGFKSRSHYYETCSAAQYLSEIKIPTVIISAENDPFVMPDDYKKATLSSQCLLHLEKSGGHMGYLAQSGWGYSRWLDEALGKYLTVMGA